MKTLSCSLYVCSVRWSEVDWEITAGVVSDRPANWQSSGRGKCDKSWAPLTPVSVRSGLGRSLTTTTSSYTVCKWSCKLGGDCWIVKSDLSRRLLLSWCWYLVLIYFIYRCTATGIPSPWSESAQTGEDIRKRKKAIFCWAFWYFYNWYWHGRNTELPSFLVLVSIPITRASKPATQPLKLTLAVSKAPSWLRSSVSEGRPCHRRLIPFLKLSAAPDPSRGLDWSSI